MTVSELIRELQAMPPHHQVRVVMGSYWLSTPGLQTVLESGGRIEPQDFQATEADEALHMGPFVLIRGR